MIHGDGKHVLIQVKVEAFARNKAIQFTDACDDFPVLVRVTGATWHHAEEMPRAGLDVVVVLNVRKNVVKEAVMMIVDGLSPNDRLSILFYGRGDGESVQIQHVMELTFMSDHGRDVARLKISELAQSHVDGEYERVGPVLPKAAEVHPRTLFP
jgi:hypothetical protein